MMNMQKWLVMAGVAAALSFSSSQALAQNNGGRFNRGNFDPAQMRQRMMERYKETLEFTSDDEWKAVEPLVEKVMQARMQSLSGMGRGMFGRRPGGDNGDQGQRRGGMFGQSNPEADALEKAIEAKAPKAEIKAALDKFVAARKAKLAELEKAQDDLRKVLTSRQEAIATLNGLL